MRSFLSLFRARDYVLEIVRTADSYLPASDRNASEIYRAHCCETLPTRCDWAAANFKMVCFQVHLHFYFELNLDQLQYVCFSYLVLPCDLALYSGGWSLGGFQKCASPSNAFVF